MCILSQDQGSLHTASATNLSNNSNNIILQTTTLAVSNFNSPGNLINVQVIFDSVTQRGYISDKPKESLKLPKIRIVFDASAKYHDLSEKSQSLSETLDKGPCLLPYLFNILSRFRVVKIGLIGDIKQAFLQICIEKTTKIICAYFGSTVLMIQHQQLKFFASPF